MDWPVEPMQLNLNEMSVPVIDRFPQLRSAQEMRINRYETGNDRQLVQMLSDFYEVDPACILLEAGADGALGIIFLMCAALELPLLIPRPSYTGYTQIAGLARCHYRYYVSPVFRPLPAFDERAALVLCNPDNPTGSVLPDIERLIRMHHGPVIVDEAYGEFAPGTSASVFINDPSLDLVVVRTFSKAFGAASIRLGYLLAKPALVALLRQFQLRYPVSTLAIRAGIDLLTCRKEMEESVIQVHTIRNSMKCALEACGLPTLPSHTNFLASPGTDTATPQHISRELHQRGILVSYFEPSPDVGELVRITMGSVTENEAVVAQIAEILAMGV